MNVFILNFLASAIEVFKPSRTLTALIVPCAFFAFFFVYTQDFNGGSEIAFLAGACAFLLKFLFGGIRVGVQELLLNDISKEKVFYFSSLVETIVLYFLLNIQ